MSVRRHLVALLAVVSLIAGFTIGSASSAGALPPSPTVPAAPTSLVAYRGNGSAEIGFTAGANGGAAITNYKYSTDNGSSWTAFSPAVTTPTVTIGGLTNGTTYSVRLRAVNSVGDGAVSDAVSVTPAAVNTTTWSSRSAAAAEQWYSVAYGNGIFVAVAGNGGSGAHRVMTSTDGVSWTGRTAAEQNRWASVTYGNGLFVAVAQSGTNRVMTSPDGVTWTARSAAAASNWQSITFGNGLFVAVSTWGTVMTSSDGASWTSRTAAANKQWYSVAYGNGRFVVISASDAVMTSTDGVNWSSETAAAASGLRSVTYGNGLFVATGGGGMPWEAPAPYVVTSPDGATWTSRTAPSQSAWSSVTFGNGLFVAVSTWGQVMTSPDGMTWTAGTAAASNTWYGLAYGNGVFVALAYSGTDRVMTSTLASLATAPAAPTSLVATAGDGSALIAFTAGADGGAAITKYQYKVGSGAWTDVVGTTSPFTITGLTNYQISRIRLRAVNAAGDGVASEPVQVWPRVTGSALNLLKAQSSSRVLASVSALNPVGGTVSHYWFTAYAKGTNTVVATCRAAADVRSCVFLGLLANTEYDVSARGFFTLTGSADVLQTLDSASQTVRTKN